MLDRLTSEIYNNVTSGLGTPNFPLTLEQIEDEIVAERLDIITNKKGIININDLIMSINCLDVDCKSLTKCCTTGIANLDSVRHTEIPQVLSDYGDRGFYYIGSADGQNPYTIYTDSSYKYHSLRRTKSRSLKPYVWVDLSPNENNMNDVFIFNTPLVTKIKAVIVPKDPRQLSNFSCCRSEEIYNFNALEKTIVTNLSYRYIDFYRKLAMPITPNNQVVNK